MDAVAGGQRVAALFGDAPTRPASVDLYAVLADSARACLRVGKTTLDADRFPSLTPDCPQVHLFEREIAEQYGVRPEGHPWFKPVRFHASYRPGHDAWGRKPGEASGHRRHRLLPRRGGGDPRGRGRPGPRRRHRAGAFPLPVPRRAGLSPGDLARLPAPRGRAGAGRRPEQADDPHDGDGGRRHVGRPRDGLLPGGRGAGRLPGPDPGRGAARRRPGAGTAGQPHRRPGRAGRRRRLPADRLLLRAAPRRFPQPDRAPVRQPVRPRPGAAGRRRLRPRRRPQASSAWSGSKRRTATSTERGRPALELAVGAGPVRGHRRGRAGRLPWRWGWSARRPGPAASSATSGTTFPTGIFRFAQVPVSTWTTGDVFARAYVRWLEIQRSVAFIREQLAGASRRADPRRTSGR